LFCIKGLIPEAAVVVVVAAVDLVAVAVEDSVILAEEIMEVMLEAMAVDPVVMEIMLDLEVLAVAAEVMVVSCFFSFLVTKIVFISIVVN